VTLLTALISAVVALLVSTVVFSWQRSVEQEFALRKEKREIYRTFLFQLERAIQARDANDADREAASLALWNTFHQIRLFGDGVLTNETYEFLDHLAAAYGERRDFLEQVNDTYTDLMGPRDKLLRAMILDIEETEIKWAPIKSLRAMRDRRSSRGATK
jgi:cytochrome c biogenesis factor